MNRRQLIRSTVEMAAAIAFRRSLRAEGLHAFGLRSAESARLANDPRRPQFHLLPAANWMNDPNGPIYWNGHYHMFYQYNPNGAYWGDMHWGHAISPDMVHWKHLPVALAPTPGGPDAAGCFSGTAVVDKGVVNVIYTGVVNAPEDQATIKDGKNTFRESQCLASSTDPELKTWSKLPRPVLAVPPTGMNVTGFRDPSPWRSGAGWKMTVGSGVPHQGGAVLLYEGKDLEHWNYLHIVASGTGSGKQTVNPVDSGDMWECPDLFPLGGKHVLIYSAKGSVYWQSGVLDESEMRFHPEHSGILDYGSYYAAKTQLDKQGNRIVWGWVPETRPLAEYKAAGWAGLMSLPRVLTFDPDGQLGIEISQVVHVLRGAEQKLRPGSGTQIQIAQMSIQNCCGEVLASMARTDRPFTFSLIGKLPSGELPQPILELRYDPGTPNQIVADGKPLPFRGLRDNSLEFDIYMDGSVAELILQRSTAYTRRFYYTGSEAPTVRVRFEGAVNAFQKLSLWQIHPISTDRLTS